MKTRREILSAAVCASSIIPTSSKAESGNAIERCWREAGKLAELMQLTTGGQWRVSVDQNLEFILVQKILT